MTSRQTERDARRAELKAEAIRSLQAFIKTGLEGFRQKAIDRLVMLGVETADSFKTPSECEQLLTHTILCQ